MSDQNIDNEVMKAVTDLRDAVKTYGDESHEVKARSEKMEKLFAEQEEKNQKLVADLAEERKSREDIDNRMKELELSVIEQSTGGKKSYKDSEDYKALQMFAKSGMEAISIEQKATLRTDNNTQGGYLVMPEMDNMILKNITEISPMRSVARVRSVGSKTLEIPTRTGIPTASYEGEAAEGPESNSTYGNETLTAYRLSVTVPFTMDMLMDSEFDLESEINGDVAEAFAQAEGRNFVLGDGAKKPEGFISAAAGLQGDARESSTSGQIDADDLILLSGDLKVGYNPMYAFNRRSLAQFRTFKGTNGQYLWQAGLGGGAPNTIAGDPYVLMEDMPDIASGTFSVAYADFMRGYTIIDRTGMSIVRDELTRKKNAIVEMTFHRWNHGQVVLKEAFKLLQTKA